MYNRKDVLNSFLDTIRSISDLEYQQRAWILGIPPGTDFDETVNNYSLDAEGVFKNYKDFKLTEAEFEILKIFDKQFTDFYENNYWPHEFINTPEWAKIVDLANEVLKVFNYSKKPFGN